MTIAVFCQSTVGNLYSELRRQVVAVLVELVRPTVFTFCQRWAIEFWGVGNGSLDGLLGDVICLVDNVGHRIFPIQWITSGIALVLRTGKAVLCLSVLRFSKNPALHGFKTINY